MAQGLILNILEVKIVIYYICFTVMVINLQIQEKK